MTAPSLLPTPDAADEPALPFSILGLSVQVRYRAKDQNLKTKTLREKQALLRLEGGDPRGRSWRKGSGQLLLERGRLMWQALLWPLTPPGPLGGSRAAKIPGSHLRLPASPARPHTPSAEPQGIHDLGLGLCVQRRPATAAPAQKSTHSGCANKRPFPWTLWHHMASFHWGRGDKWNTRAGNAQHDQQVTLARQLLPRKTEETFSAHRLGS